MKSRPHTIHFAQAVTDESTIYLDAEKADSKTITVAEYEVKLYSQGGVLFAMWTHDGYYFEIVCYGDFCEDDIVSLIRSVNTD